MKQLKQISLLTNSYKISTVTEGTDTFIMVPVVMMVEGVHSGSHGPIYHSAEVLKQSVELWPDIPVVVNHPQNEKGDYISVNQVMDTLVGRVVNPQVKAGKLTAQLKLNEKQLEDISPEALYAIQQQQPLDVSVGIYAEETQQSGEWNGEKYDAIALNHHPDHLALLPGDVGACSWDDGCGIRTNSKQKEGNEMDVQKTLVGLNGKGYAVRLMANARSLTRQIEALRATLNEKDSEEQYHYLVEAYEDSFIYEAYQNKDNKTRYFKQQYVSNDALEITLVNDPVEVERKLEYVQIQANINPNTEGDNMSKVVKPCIVTAVNGLISNTASNFSEEDREWLQGLEEGQLKKLMPSEPAPEPQVNKEAAIKVIQDTLKTPADFMGLLPQEMKDQFQSGLRLHKERRTQLVQSIMANTAEAWTEDELNAMPTDMLEKISKSVTPVVDYSANGGGSHINTNQSTEEALLPPGVV